MTKKQKIYKNSLLRSVHTSRTYLEVYSKDRELYEQMLKNSFGVKSSKDLSIDELKRLILFLNGKSNDLKKDLITTNQKSYILVMWDKKSFFKDEDSLLKFAKRILQREVNSIDEITKREAIKLIAAVKNLKPLKPANNPNFQGKLA